LCCAFCKVKDDGNVADSRKEKRLTLKPQFFDVKHQLTYPDGSHMLLNMRFSLEELHFIFSEIKE